MSGAVSCRGPLITGPASHLAQSRWALQHPAGCTLFPAINCDLCVYVKKTRPPSSSVAARGLGRDLPNRRLLGHLFRAEGSCSRGGRGGAGSQARAVVPAGARGVALRLCEPVREGILDSGKSHLAPWSTGPAPWLAPMGAPLSRDLRASGPGARLPGTGGCRLWGEAGDGNGGRGDPASAHCLEGQATPTAPGRWGVAGPPLWTATARSWGPGFPHSLLVCLPNSAVTVRARDVSAGRHAGARACCPHRPTSGWAPARRGPLSPPVPGSLGLSGTRAACVLLGAPPHRGSWGPCRLHGGVGHLLLLGNIRSQSLHSRACPPAPPPRPWSSAAPTGPHAYFLWRRRSSLDWKSSSHSSQRKVGSPARERGGRGAGPARAGPAPAPSCPRPASRPRWPRWPRCPSACTCAGEHGPPPEGRGRVGLRGRPRGRERRGRPGQVPCL